MSPALRLFAARGGRLVPVQDPAAALWIDLLSPDDEALAKASAILGAGLPSRVDMEEIEHSSRVWRDGAATYLTVMVPTRPDTGDRAVGPVAFVLAGGRLATVRFHEPRAFEAYPDRAGVDGIPCDDAEGVLHGLLEGIIDRLADILERIGEVIEGVSRGVFSARAGGADGAERRDLRRALIAIGAEGALLGDVRMGLLTLDRALGFLDHDPAGRPGEVPISAPPPAPDPAPPPAAAAGLADEALAGLRRAQARDVASLSEHAGFLSQKITLALEATLGMISIEQNASIRVFSVVATVFLPPTLIASIYGMNFAAMPELDWGFGYPAALALMAASSGLALWALRRLGGF